MLFLFVLFVLAFSLKSADHIVCLRNNDHEVGTTTAILPSELDFAMKKFPFMCDNPCPCVCESVPPLAYTNNTRIEGNVLSITFHNSMARALRVDAYWNHGSMETYIIENEGGITHTYPNGIMPGHARFILTSLCREEKTVEVPLAVPEEN